MAGLEFFLQNYKYNLFLTKKLRELEYYRSVARFFFPGRCDPMRDQMKPKGQVSREGELWLSETELCGTSNALA